MRSEISGILYLVVILFTAMEGQGRRSGQAALASNIKVRPKRWTAKAASVDRTLEGRQPNRYGFCERYPSRAWLGGAIRAQASSNTGMYATIHNLLGSWKDRWPLPWSMQDCLQLHANKPERIQCASKHISRSLVIPGIYLRARSTIGRMRSVAPHSLCV